MSRHSSRFDWVEDACRFLRNHGFVHVIPRYNDWPRIEALARGELRTWLEDNFPPDSYQNNSFAIGFRDPNHEFLFRIQWQ